MIFDRFLIELWRLVGSKFDDFWITFSKQRFHENEHPYNDKSTFSRFGGSGNRSKIDLKTVSKITSILDRIWMDFGPIFGGFSAPKIDQNRYQFRDRFLEGLKIDPRRLTIQVCSSRIPTKDTFGVLTGPHTVVQLSGGPGTRDWGLVLRILHAVCRWHGEFLLLLWFQLQFCLFHSSAKRTSMFTY